ncbi:GNAT superfamily N-acetyltransferase [Kineosphaera limosa]|uniref:Putative acetyltransferase n=1 Tax=Kineosphaera limosa NBRC 100340 TaxID=1184609 RepID=K6XE28_9MICO|nr:GNAT family N-acetyltransferase [Kineosphaera limosa]NYE01988.1 GNAT superfamily N-acetyltransferase [Kineosphaera limosa]GAB97094.1 putative acetyltransferase [Kineosphaera limosa NBRC 100340]
MTEPVELTQLREEDVAALAAIHRRAFSGFFLAELGEGFLREFYRGFLHDDTAIAVVARTADGPIGAAVGTVAPQSFYSRLLKRRWHGFARAATGTALRHPRTIPRLARAVLYRGDAPEGLPDAALFASMCVDTSHAGGGVGAQLSQAWSARARALGAHRAYLTTDADDNDAVNRHHQRHGWIIESSYTTPEGRRMHRYVKTLHDDQGGSR